MFGPRSPRYPMLRAYLTARPRPLPIPVGSPRTQALALSTATAVSGLAVLGSGFHPFAATGLLAVGGALAFVGLRTKRPAPPTPEQRLAAEADAIVRKIGQQIEWNRLHRAFHPAVGAILEECAGYHARVLAALEEGDWAHREELREGALTAARIAMDEAIVLAGKTLPYVPEARPLEQLSDTLEDIGFGPLSRASHTREPVPPAFRPARELAERLRELAMRCETAAQQRRHESPEPVSAAFRHLDATIGEMRRIEEAEGELRQGA